MIISKIKVESFAGLMSKEISLNSGANIVLGLNEAGKSTLFKALQHALFTPTHLSKPQFKTKINPIIPIDGDTAKVELEIIYKKEKYILTKTWGATNSSSLRLPTGSQLSDDGAISTELNKILPATEGTFNSTLLTYQSGLGSTLEGLKTDDTTIEDLGNILRKSILNTDGVSIEKVRSKIFEKEIEYLGRWDVEHDRPEKNKMDWSKGTGIVVKNYYTLEALKKELQESIQFEQQYDELNESINSTKEERDVNLIYVDKNKKVVDGARERRILDAEQKSYNSEVEKLMGDLSKWPSLSCRIDELKQSIPIIESKLKEYQLEFSMAEAIEKNNDVVNKYQHVSKLFDSLKVIENELSLTKKLTDGDLNELVIAKSNNDNLLNSIEAGKLAVNIKALKDIDFRIKKDLDDYIDQKITAAKSLQIEAGGKIVFENQDMIFEVSSGEGDFDKIEMELKLAKNNLDTLLKKFTVNSLEEANEIKSIYNNKLVEFRSAKSVLENELEGETFDELKKKFDELPKLKKGRSISEISKDRADTQSKYELYQRELRDGIKIISEYEKKYKTISDLALKLAEATSQVKIIEGKINLLPKLPPDVTNIDKFISEFELKNDSLQNLKQELSILEIRRATLEGSAPDISSEETKSLVEQADSNFNSALKRAKALLYFKQKFEAIAESLDANTFLDLEKSITESISMLTQKKYNSIAIDKNLPTGFIRNDERNLSIEYLSTGTLDILGLALRLTLAKYFLADSDGLLVMDDPLVNLDPIRQNTAAEILKGFSVKKQLIIFTCHPSHAELLGGNLIQLN